MDNRMLGVGAAIVRQAAERLIAEDMSAEDKLRACFRAALDSINTWYVRGDDDDGHFKLGVAAFLIIIGPDDPAYQRTMNSLEALKGLTAAIAGVPVDMAVVMGVRDDEEPPGEDRWFPLMPLYREIKEEMT